MKLIKITNFQTIFSVLCFQQMFIFLYHLTYKIYLETNKDDKIEYKHKRVLVNRETLYPY